MVLVQVSPESEAGVMPTTPSLRRRRPPAHLTDSVVGDEWSHTVPPTVPEQGRAAWRDLLARWDVASGSASECALAAAVLLDGARHSRAARHAAAEVLARYAAPRAARRRASPASRRPGPSKRRHAGPHPDAAGCARPGAARASTGALATARPSG